MPVRIGVDVGGTFTKAVACESSSGEVVARSVVPTTHAAASGVAEGVVHAIGEVTEAVLAADLGPIQLVSHSTTQAVNALLEGDTSIVGVIGIGRRPDLKRSKRRTEVGDVRLAPGRRLVTRHEFIDATGGIDDAQMRSVVHNLLEEGAESICVSEAFGVEDARGEWMALDVAEAMGVPACAGHELTGLYGLELRTVTAALNASILPTALRTARLVEEAVQRDAPGVPLLVMRGDGGAVGLNSMKRHPLLTAFSGPAASVAGALRHVSSPDGVVVEVGGTSTNVSTIKGGRPVLSYVRVLDHVTCVRSLDVRVVGVAGGSLVRIGRRFGRMRVTDVGPRSAHIAGLTYSCFAEPGELNGAAPRLIAPRPGDPVEYLILETNAGRRFALTVTCAANALGQVPQGSYARGKETSARDAFTTAAEWLGTDWQTLARTVIEVAGAKVAQVVHEAAAEQQLAAPEIIGLGGGAGALIPSVGRGTGLAWRIPQEAEVISSVGDALSIVRVEIERTLPRATTEAVAAVHREAEEAALRAGASPTTVQLESQAVPEKGALRVVAFGSVALEAAVPGEVTWDEGRESSVARDSLGSDAALIARTPFYAIYASGERDDTDFAVLDRHASIAARGQGTVLSGTGAEVAAALGERVPAMARHYGPLSVAPAVRLVRGARLVDLALLSDPDSAVQAAMAECSLAHDDLVVALLSRD